MDLQHAIWRPENHNKFREKRLYKRLLNNATHGLSFSEEVVCEMGPVSYRKHDFSGLFHPTGPLASTTRLKKIKKHKNKDVHRNISLTREADSVFKIHCDMSKRYDALARTEQFSVQPCLKQEDWEAQSRNSRCQTFAQKKLGKTTEQGFINQRIPKDKCQNKSGPLLPLRKKHRYCYKLLFRWFPSWTFLALLILCLFLMNLHRVLGHVSSPASVQNCLNKTATTVGVKCIEIPRAPRPQVIQNPCDGSHVFHSKNIPKEGIFAGRFKNV